MRIEKVETPLDINQPWPERVSHYIASICHHASGGDYQQQQTYAVQCLQTLLPFKGAYWLSCRTTGEKI